MPDGESTDEKVDGALSLLGKFQIWIGIVVGALVIVVAAIAFVGSFFWGKEFRRTDADVTSVSCGKPVKTTRCTGSGDDRQCITDTRTTCDMELKFSLDGKPYTDTVTDISFREGHEPTAHDTLAVYVDTTNPDVVKMPDAPDLITPQKATLIRIVAAVIFVLAVIGVIVNVKLRHNRNFQRLQGTFGALDAVGGMFRR